MRTFDIKSDNQETFIGKVCISKEIYDKIDDKSLSNCLNNFLAKLNVALRIEVINKDIQPCNNKFPNQFIRVSPNDKNVWILCGIREPTYYLKERTDSEQY